ncbi:MAG: helicase-related protein, partial [Bacteroidota bacterium]
MTKNQRKEILQWFKVTPNAVLTSVGILTTGFDEPTIEGIMLNRATRSLALYYQMIGRGSRVIPGKSTFEVVDLGNNAARFGLWSAEVDWQKIFRSPQYFLQNIITDDEIERNFKYIMPSELRERFKKTDDVYFDIKEENKRVVKEGRRTSVVLDRAIEQHANMIHENSEDYGEALELIRLLSENISDRIRRYCYCICNSTKNYRDWAKEDYTRKLKLKVASKF